MRWLVLLGLLAACVTPLATDSRPCPCDDDHACCVTGTGVSRCVRKQDVQKLACLTDASTPDAPADVAAADTADTAVTPPDAAPDQPGPPGAPRCQNGGGALRGTYFASENFKDISYQRSEPALVFDSFSFLSGKLPGGRFTAVFSGELQPERTDRYTFLATSNGALRVWIGGELVIDAWDFPCCPFGLSAAVTLEGGRRHDVLIEYFAVDEASKLALYWRDSQSPGWSVIPPCSLFEKVADPSACPAPFGDCVPPGTPACTVQDANGVRATYFTTDDFSGEGRTQNENFISSGWLATQAPAGARSVRWEADLVAPAGGRYTLFLAARGVTRLVLEGRTLLQTPAGRAVHEVEVPVDLGTHRHAPLLIEQSLGDWGFWIRLRWKGPSMPRATIPRCRFFLPRAAPGMYDGGTGGDTGP